MSTEMQHQILENLLEKHQKLINKEFSDYLTPDIFSDVDCLTLNGQTIRNFNFKSYNLRAVQFLNCCFIECIFDNELNKTLFYNNTFVKSVALFKSESSSFSGNSHSEGMFHLRGTAGIDYLTGIETEINLEMYGSVLFNLAINRGSFNLVLNRSEVYNLHHFNVENFKIDIDGESKFI